MEALRQNEMLSLVENAVRFALIIGADEAEAFSYHNLTNNVVVERGQISRSSRIVDRGIGIRIILNKATGFAYTNVLESKEAVEKTVQNALKTAKASRPDEDWHDLPPLKPQPTVKGIYDRKVAGLQSEDLVKLTLSMLRAAEELDKRVFPIEGGVGASELLMAVANSEGVSCSDVGTVIECSLATVAQEAGEVTPVCFEFNAERSFQIDPEWVGKEAAKLAVSALRAKRIESGSTDVVFTQFALHELLYYTLINAVKADYVQRNQSALKGKIGEKVASEIVTIYDDGLLDGGLRTWKFDGEGVPHQKKLIIEKGVLRNFIYDNYTAKKEGLESTGNAFRAGYLSTPYLDATNFRFIPGKKSPEELISEIKNGLLVYSLQGAHSSNPVSGEFSVVATPAWKIVDGEIAYAVRSVMLAGNVFEILKNVSNLACNERKVSHLVVPWVLVENVKAVGK